MKKTVISLAVAAFAVFAFTAHAAEGVYVNVGVGQASNGTPPSVSQAGVAMSKASDTSMSLAAGYALDDNFAVELGYVNLGKIVAGANQLVLNESAIAVSAVGKLPIKAVNGLSLLGKAGYAQVSTKATVALALGTDRVNDFTYGAGVQYDFNQSAGVILSYDHYRAGTTGDGKWNVGNISLSGQYRF